MSMSQESNGFDYDKIKKGIVLFLEGLGLDLNDQHLIRTPDRVARAWTQFFGIGYLQKAEDILNVEFCTPYQGLVVVKDIPFTSHCCHHLVPFHGTAKIGYLPDKHVTGLSKLGRILDMYAKRLQVQEELTQEVAQAIERVLHPRGVGVVITAEHMCMTHRGVQKPGSVTVTSCLLGEMLTDPQLRQEFLNS